MGNYSYLPHFPIHTATTMQPLNILSKHKKHLAKLLISALLKNYQVCVIFLIFQATYYIILYPYLKHCFDIKMWYNLRHGGHDCLWYHIFIYDNCV